jgi:hypothetical protein
MEIVFGIKKDGETTRTPIWNNTDNIYGPYFLVMQSYSDLTFRYTIAEYNNYKDGSCHGTIYPGEKLAVRDDGALIIYGTRMDKMIFHGKCTKKTYLWYFSRMMVYYYTLFLPNSPPKAWIIIDTLKDSKTYKKKMLHGNEYG